jgi:hypothetical protein
MGQTHSQLATWGKCTSCRKRDAIFNFAEDQKLCVQCTRVEGGGTLRPPGQTKRRRKRRR